ncbi:MAG: indolepyruvate oxidoreductase subunit beta [Clostridiales bacterium]|jgi:indolepyruvate ferredoxin oxidoreductase beta subunit|nr:indolepyruvate oxidoreductase subunit beta [Clostridiales bacterium]
MTKGTVKSILLVGVGGQGTILAAKILTQGLMEAGHDVKMSEIHGMSQRGGSVSSQVRYGEKVYSPVIERGSADLLVSFEKMEALRWLEYAKKDAKAVVNDCEIMPMPVIIGSAAYSGGILDELKARIDTTVIDAADEAGKLGNPRVMNIILLGAAAKLIGIDNLDWDGIISANVKPAFAEINKQAFKRGTELCAI